MLTLLIGGLDDVADSFDFGPDWLGDRITLPVFCAFASIFGFVSGGTYSPNGDTSYIVGIAAAFVGAFVPKNGWEHCEPGNRYR